MAQYIDADELIKEVGSLEQLARKRVYDTPTNSPVYERYCTQFQERKRILSIIKAHPTAEVVPKSEVAQEFTCFVGDPHKVDHCPYLDEIEKSKTDVAREIFEELEKIFDSYGLGYFNSNLKRTIDELKKKYTEENSNNE